MMSAGPGRASIRPSDRLYQKGWIDDPANKAKSVMLTDEGLQKAEELFKALFTRQP